MKKNHSHLMLATAAAAILSSAPAIAQTFSSPFDAEPQAAETSLRSEARPQAASKDNLGNHIATEVLNMNGYNITNLNDPFFDGDAVTLRWHLQNDSLGNHKAAQDLDMGGFSITNIGNIEMDGKAISRAILMTSTVSGSTIDSSNLSNSTFKGGKIEGAELSDVTITGGTLEGVTLSDIEIGKVVLNGAELKGDTKIDGPATFGADLDAGMNRVTNIADAKEDGDAVNLKTLKEMVSDMLEEHATEMRAEAEEAEKANDVATGSDDTFKIHGDPEGLFKSDLPNASPVREEVVIAIVEGLTAVEGGIEIAGNLDVSGTISGVTAQFRAAPAASQIIGALMHEDATAALAGIAPTAFVMEDGNVSLGIDPATIPDELAFLVRTEIDGNGFEQSSIDYVQMIAPMLAAIQHLEMRVAELEAQGGR